MKPLVFALILFTLSDPGRAGRYDHFANLSDEEKDRVVWQLHEDGTWGRPDQKPICRDLLEHQGYSSPNDTAWTTGAIDVAETRQWTDLKDLVTAISQRPKNIWILERAFRYLRRQEGKDIPASIETAVQTIAAAGQHESPVTDRQLAAAIAILEAAPDQDASAVYLLRIACWHAGKGGSDRGRLAAVEVLRKLTSDLVLPRLQQLRLNGPRLNRVEVEWVMTQLGIPIDPSSKGPESP